MYVYENYKNKSISIRFVFSFLGDKPPRIDASRFAKTVTIKAGKPLDLDVPYDAYPPPIMTWFKDGTVIPSEGDTPCKTSIDPKRCKLNM